LFYGFIALLILFYCNVLLRTYLTQSRLFAKVIQEIGLFQQPAFAPFHLISLNYGVIKWGFGVARRERLCFIDNSRVFWKTQEERKRIVMADKTLNLMLPGNPRYQPKELIPFFGYDNLMRGLAEVEIANLKALGKIGVIGKGDIDLLTPELISRLMAITTTQVDEVERQITKHDVRAWVRLAQEILPPELARWTHVPLTSYDPLDTGRILVYYRAYLTVLKPAIFEVMGLLMKLVEEQAQTVQIGRTHGQHALPITVGFWLATILSRIVYNAYELEHSAEKLVGKISGAVGAYNAQVGLGLTTRSEEENALTYEETVLELLGLKAAPISTQILPPEPLEHFLHACFMMSAAFGQLGDDCRHLMRSELNEVAEAFEPGQVGSSTMAQKRNPINFENLKAMWKKNVGEYVKVLLTLHSEHQRDLTDSAVMRDFPTILVNLMTQLNTLRRKNQSGAPFLARLSFNNEALKRNLGMNAHVILAEPIYIALQMAGYPDDAHELVNRKLVPRAQKENLPLAEILRHYAQTESDPYIGEAYGRIPAEVKEMLACPEKYTGDAAKKALEVVSLAQECVCELSGEA